jgi:hypothetical protein
VAAAGEGQAEIAVTAEAAELLRSQHTMVRVQHST